MKNNFAHNRSWGPTPKYLKVLNYEPPKKDFIFIAGPCSVESSDQINEVAKLVKKCGGTHLRGGVFRAGTYPGFNFGLISSYLIREFANAAWSNGLKTIIEILDYENIDRVLPYADCFQVGARQMQNYNLLKVLAKSKRQVFLKRNMGATVDEWLGACEYLLTENLADPVLVERGSSTYHNDVRWTPTLHTVASVKSICKVPIVFDASHSTGRRDLVPAMAMAGVASGADGVLIEVHPEPEKSLSDAEQAIDFNTFENLSLKIKELRAIL